MRRGILASFLAIAAALALAACAGMPMTGSVQQGRSPGTGDDTLDVAFQPASPRPGATPDEIVNGFIAAATNPSGDWAIAREFLAPQTAREWNPNASVTIDGFADRELTKGSDTSFVLTVSPRAQVDETGAYVQTDAGTSTLPFELAKQADGEWRITKLEDGIVLDRSLFPQVFRSYPLMFFDPSWQYLVPDVRWFATRNNTPARIVAQLVDGAPSPWLAGAVVSAFPDDIRAPTSVPVTSDGVARVELPSAVISLPPEQQARMQAQLEATLGALSTVTDVVMTVGNVDIAVSPAATRSTRVDARPAVLTDDGFGFLAGSDLQSIAGITQAFGKPQLQNPTAIVLGPDRDFAGVQLASGAVARVRSDQSWDAIDSRTDLIAPTADGFGYIWTVPAAHPTAVEAHGADGSSVTVGDAWSGASRIEAMAVSRDGARVIALVDIGGHSEAWIAGIVRENGAPARLAPPMRLATLPSAGLGVAWLDDATVGIVTVSEGEVVVLTQQVAGLATTSVPGADVTTIAGGSQLTAVRVLASDGVMYLWTGARWQQNATGIRVLAVQQGAPQ